MAILGGQRVIALEEHYYDKAVTAHFAGADSKVGGYVLENLEEVGAGRRSVGVGQPDDDAVITGGRLLVDPVAFGQSPADSQRQVGDRCRRLGFCSFKGSVHAIARLRRGA